MKGERLHIGDRASAAHFHPSHGPRTATLNSLRRTCAASFARLFFSVPPTRPPLQLRGDPRVEQRLRCEPNAVGVAARARFVPRGA